LLKALLQELAHIKCTYVNQMIAVAVKHIVKTSCEINY